LKQFRSPVVIAVWHMLKSIAHSDGPT
jgi:hypothetical protein